MHPYNAHCFSGHSPIWQVDSIKKLRNDHASINAPKTILNLLAHINGKAKNKALKLAKKHRNFPDCPKELPAGFHPVITQCLLSIMTNGCVVVYINAKQSKIPMVWECFIM